MEVRNVCDFWSKYAMTKSQNHIIETEAPDCSLVWLISTIYGYWIQVIFWNNFGFSASNNTTTKTKMSLSFNSTFLGELHNLGRKPDPRFKQNFH